MKTKTAVLSGKPYAGNPHVRFDEGEVASAKPRRGSLLYKHMVRGFVCLAFAAGVSSVAFGYEDDYITTTDDSVVFKEVGGRKVYVFTNTAAAATLTFRQKMTLEEALVVGGGGAGGGFHGAGGGGGGVLDLTARTFCLETAQIALTVGKGGAVNGTGVGKSGSPSSVTIGGVTSTAFGGGGGGCGTSSLPSTGSNGSGGGASCPNSKGAASVLASSDEYTSGQGNPGGNNPGDARAGGGGGYSERGHDGRSFSVAEDKKVTGICGDGGEGLTNAITGVEVVYGSGGGGGGGTSNFGVTWAGKGGTNAGDGGQGRLSQNPDAATASSSAGSPAPAGFGGGGGGGGAFKENGLSSVAKRAGGAGGSGTVILAFSVGGEPGKPVIAQENVNFTFPDGESQPYFNITLTGAEGAAYSAVVKVYCGTGAQAQAGEAYQSTNSFDGVANGGSVEGFAFVYPQPDETFLVKIVASAESVEDTVFTTTVTVPSDCRVPSHVGKGGGAGVIHVRPGAHGLGTGLNWTDAYTDFCAALKEISAERPELWLAGDEGMNSAMTAEVAPSVAAAIRGGFAGTECSPSERRDGARSRIDGNNAENGMIVQNVTNLTIEGFCFTRAKTRGLMKTGAGDIVVTNCMFDANGLTSGTVAGRAMDLSGVAASTRATVADCTIVNHCEASSQNGTAGALYLHTLASAAVSDTLFASNGLAFGTIPYSVGQMGRFSTWGVALAVDGVATVVERCDFRVNLALAGNLEGSVAGGVVMFRGASGGSVVRNCIFAGNVSQHTQNTTFSDSDGGALVFKMTDAAETASVENCTFYRNLFEGLDGTAALNVLSGSVEVKNSIFRANLTGVNNAGAIADIRVRDGAAATVAYTMFDGLAASTNDLGGTLSFGQGVTTNDPCFVTSLEDLGPHVAMGDKNGVSYVIFSKAGQNALCAIDCHVRPKSPAVDAGDPRSACRAEPHPNGHRVNLGAYGNTPEAMTSKLGLMLFVR